MDFIYDVNPSRVIFAAGARSKAAEELDRLGTSRIIVVTTPPQADLAAELARQIGHRAGIVYPGARKSAPTNVTEAALTAVSSVKADGILAIGGGSAIGLSKAIALRTDLPQVVIPTNFAGSEITPILEETERDIRIVQRSAKVLPETVIYDPELVSVLPSSFAGPSAMVALAHSIEALCASDSNPVISLVAEESIRALKSALPAILTDATGSDHWTEALYGSWLAGVCLGSVSMGLHHALCRSLVDVLDIDQANAHCFLLPYTAAVIGRLDPQAAQRIARALGCDDPPKALYDITRKAIGPRNFKQIGIPRVKLEAVADHAMKGLCDHSVLLTPGTILEILIAACDGRRP